MENIMMDDEIEIVDKPKGPPPEIVDLEAIERSDNGENPETAPSRPRKKPRSKPDENDKDQDVSPAGHYLGVAVAKQLDEGGGIKQFWTAIGKKKPTTENENALMGLITEAVLQADEHGKKLLEKYDGEEYNKGTADSNAKETELSTRVVNVEKLLKVVEESNSLLSEESIILEKKLKTEQQKVEELISKNGAAASNAKETELSTQIKNPEKQITDLETARDAKEAEHSKEVNREDVN